MAVVSIKDVSEGRGGTADHTQGKDVTRRVRVVTDSDETGPIVIMYAIANIVPIGSPYITASESDSTIFLRAISPTQSSDDVRVWYADLHYSSRQFSGGGGPGGDQGGGGSGAPGTGGGSPEGRPQSPLDRPVAWSFTFVEEKRAVLTDLDGAAVANSAGRYFSPAYEVPKMLGQITAVKNYATFTYDKASDFLNTCNQAEWHGLFKYSVLIKGLSIQSMYENGVSFEQATWTFLHDKDKWRPTKILDRGPYYLDGAGKPVRFTDKFGKPMEEGYLNGTGGKLAAGAPVVYISRNFVYTLDFTTLGF